MRVIKFVFFNGPPLSGKTTCVMQFCNILRHHKIAVYTDSFAAPMKEFMAQLLGKPYSSIDKDKEHPTLSSTPREALINMSEVFFKPVFGEDIFARALVYRACMKPAICVVDDLGFNVELKAVTREELYLIHVKRRGCDFTEDSRSYVGEPDYVMFNNQGHGELYDKIDDVAKRVMHGY